MTATLTPPAPPAASDPPVELQERLLGRGNELSMLPAVAVQALEVAKDPNCPIGKFAAVIERDLKLASDILAMANSVLYSPGKPVTSLHQAVVLMGFRQCKNLIMTSSLSSLMQRISLDQQWIRELLWRHGFTTAIVGLHLNRVLGTGFQGEEFTGGLIHDLGRTLLAVAVPERFAEVDLLDFVEGPELLPGEQAKLGVDHAAFGAWFVRRSGLPESLADVVARHHDLSNAEALTALVAAADHMANHLQRYLEPADYAPEENPGVQRLAELGWRQAPEVFRQRAEKLMEDAARDLVELTKPL